jgi:hypothetical protein
MSSLAQAFKLAIENEMYDQDMPPSEADIKHFEESLVAGGYANNRALHILFEKCLALKLEFYIKKHGPNVENRSFNDGDIIGIYCARQVSLNKNNKLYVREKFCGFDLSEKTINLQGYGTKQDLATEIKNMAYEYGLPIKDASLRVPLNYGKLDEVVTRFLRNK